MHCRKIVKKRIILIVILSLFIVGFLTPFFRLATEGTPIPDDVARLRTSLSADFYAISESDYTTRWRLQNASITSVEDFHDDLTSQKWRLNDTSDSSFSVYTSLLSNYLIDDYTTIGSSWHYSGTSYSSEYYYCVKYYDGFFWALDTTGAIHKLNLDWSYNSLIGNIEVGIEMQLRSIVHNGTNWYAVGQSEDLVYEYLDDWTDTGETWDISSEDGVMLSLEFHDGFFWLSGDYNNKIFKYNSDWSYVGSYDISGQDTYPWGIFYGDGNWYMVGNQYDRVYKYDDSWSYLEYYSISSEDIYPLCIFYYNNWWLLGQQNWKVYQYDNIEDVEKFYNDLGYMYMQTNTTESISIKSFDYVTHYNLSSGDYFEVDFQTSSDSEINLILLKDGVVNKTLILSPSGNSNFNRHTVQLSVDDFVEFDQLKINSTFEDEDYVRIYDIKTYKYTLVGDYADFYLGSKRTHSVNLTSSTYNLRIFDPYDDGVKVNENITIGTSDYFYIYEPVETLDCRLTLFNIGKEDHLDFEDYHISINRSLNSEWSIFNLLDNIFTADIGTRVYINVSDVFNTLIDSFDKIASSYIDLELDVYTLQTKNLMDQKTTVDINSTYVYPLLSGESVYFTLSKAYYEIGYYNNNNTYEQFTIFLNSNQAYELNRSKICFLSYADQQGNHLFFENYKTYINDSLIYENVFYREIGESINITVKDRYDIQIQSELYNVISGDNYIPITLTLYSLKIMNLQLIFNHINITRDPNWYESEMSWSEWIAPREVIDFRLFGGNYTVNLTNYEDGGFTVYEFMLNGDDALLIGSNNTIATVLINIANVNTTLNNLVTYVQINITNLNSAINNSVVMIEINLNSINSTLGNMLVNLGLNITNVANNISALYVFTNNSFINLDNVINTSFIYMENNIASYNTSISNLVIGVFNDIYLVNGTISTMITSIENNLLLMNVSIDTALFNLNTTIDLIDANITSNYILLNNSINLTNVNINDSRIAVINNLLLVNNTISTLVSQVYSAVYLINNSIYTAVVDLGTYLSLVNNTISGNLSIVLQQNEFLTELYQMTMFSDMLNWTDIGLNISLLTSQIDVWTLINNYKNQSIEVHLKYQDLIEEIIISADDLIEQWLPAEDVEYRLWSVDDEEYLDEWTALPDNKTVSFGFFETEVHIIPDPIGTPDEFDVLLTVVILLLFIVPVGVGLIYFKIRKGANRTTKAITNGKYKAFSLSKNSLKHYLKRIKNNYENNTSVITIIGLIVLVLFLSVIIFIILRKLGFIT